MRNECRMMVGDGKLMKQWKIGLIQALFEQHKITEFQFHKLMELQRK